MQIEKIYYPVVSLGPGQRVGIWTTGCLRACPGCSNPELWAPDGSRDIPVKEVLNIIHSIQGNVDGFTITGGEPFLQKRDLLELVSLLKQISTDILVYTGFGMGELLAMPEPYVAGVLESIAVIVDGPYVDKLNDGSALRGSSNQQVHILSDIHEKKYLEYLQQPRTIQNIIAGGTAISIGLPLKGDRQRIHDGLAERGVVLNRKA